MEVMLAVMSAVLAVLAVLVKRPCSWKLDDELQSHSATLIYSLLVSPVFLSNNLNFKKLIVVNSVQ